MFSPRSSYPMLPESLYLEAGFEIANDVTQGKISQVSKKVNNLFFDGGVFTPKSFASLVSFYVPKAPNQRLNMQGHLHIIIRKQRSLNGLVGFAEGIPFIGSAIAALNAIYHLFGLCLSRSKLKKTVKSLNNIERNDYNLGRGAITVGTNKVFTEAINYTVHKNRLIGSLLSLIPFIKPIVRLTQGTIFKRTRAVV